MDATMTRSSAQALQRLATGRDPEAWEALLLVHGGDILHVARHVLRDEALAEDAMQEALLLIRDRADQFKGSDDAAARAWILRIACTAALQMLRKRRGDRAREDRMVQARASTVEPREDSALRHETLLAVNAELAHLPEADRLPLVLHYYAGLSYPELAAALACPEGTAKARVSRGVEKLRRRLALLGLVFAFGQLHELLVGSPTHAAGTEAYSPKQFENWQSLLNSARKPQPVSSTLANSKGWSIMAKTCSAIAVLMLFFGLFLLVRPLNGADQNSRPAASDAPAASPRERTATVTRPPASPPAKPAAEPAKPATLEEKKAIAQSVNVLGFDLYRKITAREKGNVFFSPYSVSTALAMTYAGARENTAAEMAKVLHFSLSQERLHRACGALVADLNAPKGADGKPRSFQLAVANRLFGQQDYEFLPEFLALNKDHYGAPFQKVDFKKDSEGARKLINTWVAERTQEKIEELVPPGGITDVTRLVLTNAVYFKGDWLKAFREKLTQPLPFTLSDGKKKEVPTMHQESLFRFAAIEKRLKILELPYAGEEVTMLILLPAKADGLAGLEAEVDEAKLGAWNKHLAAVEINVYLPKFKLTWGTQDLKDDLIAMGIKDAFQEVIADFGGIETRNALHISNVFHKAFVEVNEKGTEAAAATAGVLEGERGMPEPAKEFRADHPFLFMIRENATGAILFMGRVMDPVDGK